MDENTAIAALPNVLWTNGAYVDLMEVKARCREVGAALVLDYTQSAGALQADLGVIDLILPLLPITNAWPLQHWIA